MTTDYRPPFTWIDLPPARLAVLLDSVDRLHGLDMRELVQAGYYQCEPRHVGGQGCVTHAYPVNLPGAPEWVERRISIYDAYWTQV